MRTSLVGASLLGLIVVVLPARAGLYLPPNHGPFPLPSQYRFFQFQLTERQGYLARPSVEALQDNARLKEIWDDIDALEKKRKADTLSVEEGIRLGGYDLLRKRGDEAIAVLTAVQKREPSNFMVLANLATAYFEKGLLDRAVSFQEQALDLTVWPRAVEGWSQERLRWQRRVEVFYLTFLRLRSSESRREPQPGAGNTIRLDNLFPGVRFTGREGKYAVGEIDPRQMDRLPPDAVLLVEQLVLWFPEDRPLLWLLAELLNAQGEIRAALGLLKSVRDKGSTGEGLDEHRRLLQQAVEALPPEKPPVEEPPPDTKPPDTKPPEETSAGILPNMKILAIGFGVGFLIGVLVILQFEQFFRSRARR